MCASTPLMCVPATRMEVAAPARRVARRRYGYVVIHLEGAPTQLPEETPAGRVTAYIGLFSFVGMVALAVVLALSR